MSAQFISESIYPNDAYARFVPNGKLFHEQYESHLGYQCPAAYGEKYHPPGIALVHPQMTAFDDQNELRALTQNHYHQNIVPRTEMLPGPLTNEGVMFDSTGELFNHIWKVRGEELISSISDFEDNGIIDIEPCYNILSWPGRNNPHFQSIFGFVLPDQDMAPFLDQNQNRIYEPLLGDRPIIGDEYPDAVPNELIWFVMNDVLTEQMIMPNKSLNSEFQMAVFGFDCISNSPINKTLFTQLTVINKSGTDLHDVDLGFFVNGDLGCPWDDYAGCDTSLSTFYYYNVDSVDGNIGEGICLEPGADITGPGTHLDKPPVLSCTFLSNELHSFGRAPIPTNLADSSAGYYQHLLFNGISNEYWPNDTFLIQYPDYPRNVDGWSMVTDSLDTSEVDLIISAGVTQPLLKKNERFVLTNAWFSGYDPDSGPWGQPEMLKSIVPILKEFYQTDYELNCIQNLDELCQTDCVWPGDVNLDGRVSHEDFISCQYALTKEFTGRERSYTSQSWLAYEASNWTDSIDHHINAKHADCFGDGLVESRDRQVILDNYFLEKVNMDPHEPVIATTADTGLFIELIRNRIVEGETALSPVWGTFYTQLKFRGQHIISGYSFSLILDTAYFDVSATFRDDAKYARDIYPRHSLVAYNPEHNRIDFAHGSYNRLPLQNRLITFLGRFITFRSDLSVPEGQDSLFIPFQLYDLSAIDTNGNFIELNYVQDSIFLLPDLSANQSIDNGLKLDVYPNPTDYVVNIEVNPEIQVRSVVIYSIMGRTIGKFNSNENFKNIDVSFLDPGLYIIQIELENGVVVSKRVIIVRE